MEDVHVPSQLLWEIGCLDRRKRKQCLAVVKQLNIPALPIPNLIPLDDGPDKLEGGMACLVSHVPIIDNYE